MTAASERRRRRMTRGVAAAAFVWCAGVLFVHWAAAAFACSWDTSYCAQSREKDSVYQGTLVDRQGRIARNTEFEVAFESRRSAHPRLVGGFSTDEHGRYCIVWAQEAITPFVYVGGGVRAGGYETEIRSWGDPVEGADPPPGCQRGDEGVPWSRAEDLKSSPQFIAVAVLGFAAMALLFTAFVLAATPRARLPHLAGLVDTGLTTVVAVAVWSVAG